MKKAKQENSEGDEAELSEGGEEEESSKEGFKDGEKDGDEEEEECDGPELPSGLTGEEEPSVVCGRCLLDRVLRGVGVFMLYFLSFVHQERLKIRVLHRLQSL